MKEVEAVNILEDLDLAGRVSREYYPPVFVELGDIFEQEGNDKEAELYFKKAIEITEGLYRPDHPELVDLYTHLSSLYIKQKNYSGAETLLQQALHIALQGGGDQPQVASIFTYLGALYLHLGNLEKAAQMYSQALSLYEKLAEDGLSSEFMIDVLGSLGEIHICLGSYREAMSYLEKAVVITQSVKGEQNLSMAKYLYDLGVCHHFLALQYSSEGSSEVSAHFGEAGELYIKALKMLKALGEDEHSLATDIRNVLENLLQEWTSYNENPRQKQSFRTSRYRPFMR